MFMKNIEKEIGKQLKNTENGALGYKTAGSSFVDFNFRITSYRNIEDSTPWADFSEMLRDDRVLAMKMLFFLRDIRGGVGERKTFRYILKNLASVNPSLITPLIHLVPEYGRWDDLFSLFDTPIESEMVAFIKNQLASDILNASENKHISLLAKWMPSINTSSRDTISLANRFAVSFGMSPSEYRKTLSSLRKYLNVVERDLSAKTYENIEYSFVPSKAHLRYKNVFLNKDKDRYNEFLESLKQETSKINAGTLAPYEIWHNYLHDNDCGWWGDVNPEYDETLEQLWKNLPEEGNLVNTLVVADGSGSMTIPVSGSATALDVAQSLAVYFGERCTGEFRNKFITFSESPRLVDFGDDSLASKITIASKYNEVANTDIEKVFDLVLDVAVNNSMSQSDLPDTILIISDMEFDHAKTCNVDKALMDIISDRFEQNGYTLPRLAFWNVCSRSMAIPVRENEAGIVLVSGFNTAAIKMVMTGEMDPFLVIKGVLDGERYKPIEEALSLSI